MRIQPVTGDLPAVASPPPPPARPVAQPPAAGTPVVVASAQRSGDDDDGASSQHQAPRASLPFFDPPLIAQRAVLGLPIGFLVADFARAEGISYSAASAAVDREMPVPQD